MTFDKYSELELWEIEKQLKREGKSLFREDFEAYNKLISYKAKFSTHIFWENREKYASMLKNFINDDISADDFIDEFLDLYRKDGKAVDTIEINFDPNPKSIGFFDIMDQIFTCYDVFDPEAEEDEEYNFIWFKDSMKKVFLKIQKYLD